MSIVLIYLAIIFLGFIAIYGSICVWKRGTRRTELEEDALLKYKQAKENLDGTKQVTNDDTGTVL